MLMTKKCLYMPILAVMFLVLVSCGCGGGGGGSGNTSQSDNRPGWDSLPNPVADNQNNSNNGSTNQNQNQNQNPDTPTNPDTNNQNQDSNSGSCTPVTISGMWEIVSGHGEMIMNTSGQTTTTHYTYVSGSIGTIGLKVSKNTWGGTYEGAYCVTLTGNDLASESIYEGTGTMMLYCTIDEYPNLPAAPLMTYSGSLTFDYICNNTYQDTDKTSAKYTGVSVNLISYTSTLTLEDSSTLRWTYWSKMDLGSALGSEEIEQEIVLRKVQ